MQFLQEMSQGKAKGSGPSVLSQEEFLTFNENSKNPKGFYLKHKNSIEKMAL
jgi:hypothetical protein